MLAPFLDHCFSFLSFVCLSLVVKWERDVESAQAHCSLLLHIPFFFPVFVNRASPSTFFYSFRPATTRHKFLPFLRRWLQEDSNPFFVIIRCEQCGILIEKEGRVMNHKSHISIIRKLRCKQQRKQENICCCTFVSNSRREKEGWGECEWLTR